MRSPLGGFVRPIMMFAHHEASACTELLFPGQFMSGTSRAPRSSVEQHAVEMHFVLLDRQLHWQALCLPSHFACKAGRFARPRRKCRTVLDSPDDVCVFRTTPSPPALDEAGSENAIFLREQLIGCIFHGFLTRTGEGHLQIPKKANRTYGVQCQHFSSFS